MSYIGGITEDFVDMIEHGYEDKDIALITGIDIELVKSAREVLKKEGRI